MKEAKATKFAVEPIRKILIAEEISDGGTQKAAAALEGTWIQINETMFAFVEEGVATLVYRDEYETGCACDHFKDSENVLCEHIVAFEDLSHKPQLSIESKECRWLQEYLFSLGWYTENRYLYPSLDEKLPEDEPSIEPEVVAELPPVQESPKLDPVNEDKPLDTGVEDEAEAKKYSRKCGHAGCNYVETGDDLEQVKQGIAEHRKNCTMNPANKKTTKSPMTPEAPEAVAPKTETTKKPPKEKKKVKPSTAVTKTESNVPAVEKKMPTEAEFQTIKVGRILRNQGSIYRVGGKDTPDSAAVSSYAVAEGVSTETTVLEQTAEYARATVRAYKGGRYTEGSVLIRRDAILEKLMIDLAEKNPKWIIGWSNGLPEFDLNQTVFIGDKRKILGLHIAGVVADKWMFASRDCETKAGRRAQIKILGADWREDDEVESEVEEMKTVAKR